MARKTLAVLFGLGAAGYWARRRMLRWGATKEEVLGAEAGREIIPGGKRASTMATTIEAPPARVWPWLVQMGFDRAGWYSWDRLDRRGIPSSWVIHPEWQSLSPGQRLLAAPTGKYWFEVAAVEPERLLALRTTMTPTGRQYPASDPRPRHFTDGVWAFQLQELPGGRTRLIVSTYGASRPRWFWFLTGLLFWGPAHWIMQQRQFVNLKRRAERLSSARYATPAPTAPA